MKIEINESDEKLAEMVAEEIGQELDETGRLLAERVSAAAQPLLEKAMLAAVQHVAVSMVYGVLMGRPHPACESDMVKWRAAESLVGPPPPPLCRHGNHFYCGLCLAETGEGRVKAPYETVPAPAAAQEGAQAVVPLLTEKHEGGVRKVSLGDGTFYLYPSDPPEGTSAALIVAPTPAEEEGAQAVTPPDSLLGYTMRVASEDMPGGEDELPAEEVGDV